MTRLLSAFRRLRWKLTFSYTFVTVTTLVVLEVLLVGGLLAITQAYYPFFMGRIVAPSVAATIEPFLQHSPPDTAALNKMLIELYGSPGTLNLNEMQIELPADPQELTLYVLDVDRTVLGFAPAAEGATQPGQHWAAETVPGFEPLLQTALAGRENDEPYYVRTPAGILYFAYPLRSTDNRPLGAMIMVARANSGWTLLRDFVAFIAASLLCFVAGAGVVGTVFGFFTARDLTRRLDRLQAAAEAWSLGSFDTRAADPSGDEVGQLARRLNQMADQLQAFMATRLELAALEERNRLARELHDSVKQQIFATAMQLGAARELVERDPAAARQHLAEAEQLASHARDELTQLIRELRPAALEGKGLADALRDYVQDWARQSAIGAEVRVQGERALPLLVELTIFRVAQEALANAARHSGATRIEVILKYDNDAVTLTVADNGRGFETAKVKRGVGLNSMRERVQALNGSLTVESGAGGSTIRAVIRTAPPEPPPAPPGRLTLPASLALSPSKDKNDE